MIQLAIAGGLGRTGRHVVELAARDERFSVVAALVEHGNQRIGTTLHLEDSEVPIGDALTAPCDVLIDFTVPAGTAQWLDICLERKIPLVTGATGHTDQQLERLRKAGEVIPIVYAPNFSIGIHLMRSILRSLATQLGDGFDVEVVESHHRHKVDAPSGTALALVDEIAAGMGTTREDAAVYGRRGELDERPRGQIGVHAVRMGELVGQHEVHFSGPGETLTVRHTAQSRDTFAGGALRAAAWIVDQPPGFYSLTDVMS